MPPRKLRSKHKAPAWTPFVQADVPEEDRQALADLYGQDVVDASLSEIWVNSRYQVNIHRGEGIIHLSVKRRDKKPLHDWRDLQRIKNELVGPENEAIEIYPAESRRVDSANQYHLWVFEDPAYRLPIGFGERLVTEDPGGGAVQRPFEE